MRLTIFFAFVCIPFFSLAQGPKVPSSYEFGGIKLTIKDDARKQIQTDVNNLRRSEKYFMKKLERVDMYFPIIERVLKEEKVPEDLKYLVIQESALIPDAVSSSNAVGFWQFKKPAAAEVGLRVDGQVDERMNVVSSTHGAARYFKKNNFYFNNWVYAVMAHYTGPGGATKYVQNKYKGAKKMVIDKKTHWYVKKFLAHLFAFQDELGKSRPPYQLLEYKDARGSTIPKIADQQKVNEAAIKEYNVWLKGKKIPNDKEYTVLLPVPIGQKILLADNSKSNSNKSNTSVNGVVLSTWHSIQPKAIPSGTMLIAEATKYPQIKGPGKYSIKDINGIPGIISSKNTSFETIAIEGSISLSKFKKYNELTSADLPTEGTVYYFAKKKSKANTYYHLVLPGETLWEISQKYGVKLSKLMTKNRLKSEAEIQPGLVLWLRHIRPEKIPTEILEIPQPPKEQQVQPKATLARSTELLEKETVQAADEIIVEKPTYIEQNHPSSIKEVESKKTKNHIVQRGETLFSISRSYNVTVQEILQWNNMTSGDVLNEGQELKIFAAQGEAKLDESQVIWHTVKEKDTIYGLSRRYGVTVNDIMKWNDKEDFDITTGDKIKILK